MGVVAADARRERFAARHPVVDDPARLDVLLADPSGHEEDLAAMPSLVRDSAISTTSKPVVRWSILERATSRSSGYGTTGCPRQPLLRDSRSRSVRAARSHASSRFSRATAVWRNRTATCRASGSSVPPFFRLRPAVCTGVVGELPRAPGRLFGPKARRRPVRRRAAARPHRAATGPDLATPLGAPGRHSGLAGRHRCPALRTHAEDCRRRLYGTSRVAPRRRFLGCRLPRLGQRERRPAEPQAQASASAPATTSRISCVISAWRARFISSVSRSISSPAFFDAFRIAVIRAPCSDADDSSSAR